MFRPATPGRGSGYGLGDPGHEYIPEVTESWLGPLAEEWHIRGQRGREGRGNLEGVGARGVVVVGNDVGAVGAARRPERDAERRDALHVHCEVVLHRRH